MTAAAMQQTPAVPPRPSRSADKDAATPPMPKVPPRPASKRLDRSASPNADRFAPSPLNEGIIGKGQNKGPLLSPGYTKESDDPIERAGSVPMPSVGEEGVEYSAVADEIEHQDERSNSRAASPEQTRTVDADLQLHAPKPSHPAQSAKQRVSAVTRTDSDRAASFGIGHPGAGFEERAVSRDGIKKKPSTSFSTASDNGLHTDDEHGIPEIGQRVPMNPHLGDVQAPSPAPGPETAHKRNHSRKHSARGLPPGSYGLHGHGVAPQDKLEKAYYQKHPDLIEKENHTPLHDRQNDFAMSSQDLNRLVRDSASRGTGAAEMGGTPTDEVGFQASEEYTSRMPHPASTVQKDASTPLKQTFQAEVSGPDDEAKIHVDDAKHPEYHGYGDEEAAVDDEDHEYHAPILADDEVDRAPSTYLQQPAVHPPPERRASSTDVDEPSSRPTSRPASLYHNHSQQEFEATPLEDVKEYEPLFPEETKQEKQKREQTDDANSARHHFPSKDIWEDAPNSVHFTAEVSTPEVSNDQQKRKSAQGLDERSMTPAQAFAQHQEELAEKEALAKQEGHAGDSFVHHTEEKPTWVGHQPQLKTDRPAMAKRFPSRDVWEDAPESQLYETTVSSPKEESKPEVPSRPNKKPSVSSERPAIPTRPKPKQHSNDEGAKARPVVSDRPKPQVPARPSKTPSGDSKDGEAAAKPPKPPVPSRPVGGKIAALQAGFMSDLNKRLQLGPHGSKKEDSPEEEVKEEKEKVPLSDARKGRARGPQRRAPAKSPAPPPAAAAKAVTDSIQPSAPTLSFSTMQTSWAIDPDDGDITVSEDAPAAREQTPVAEKVEQPEKTAEAPAVEVPEAEEEAQKSTESEKADEPEEPAKAAEPEESPEPEEEPRREEKTLVANAAGESILEATVEKKDGGDEVEPVAVDDEVKP